jgi:hypothetical protein
MFEKKFSLHKKKMVDSGQVSIVCSKQKMPLRAFLRIG